MRYIQSVDIINTTKINTTVQGIIPVKNLFNSSSILCKESRCKLWSRQSSCDHYILSVEGVKGRGGGPLASH